jgi:hypothetical protein
LGKLGGEQLTNSLIQALDLPLGQGNPNQRADHTLGDRPDVMTIGLIQTLPVVFVDQITISHDQDAANMEMALGHLILNHCQCRRIDAMVFRWRGAPTVGRPVVTCDCRRRPARLLRWATART